MLVVNISWSFARLAFAAAAVQTAGGVVGVPVFGQRNTSSGRVSDQAGWALLSIAERPV
jgi:hypothetical protein